ncbi:MAG: ribbon-helix-helix protein, CopG family [Limnochordaceae bacterium]|nr:ribbon-helix-helix protein, CopG family [Limnochordaceae bacterium]
MQPPGVPAEALERFSVAVRKVVRQAAEEARLRNQPVGPYHLLVAALLSEELAPKLVGNPTWMLHQVMALLPPRPPESEAPPEPPALSDEAKEILLSSVKRARLHGYPFVLVEHLLVAIVDRLSSGPDAPLVQRTGLAVEAALAQGHFTPKAREAVRVAMEEARQRNQPVGAPHLLLGVLRSEGISVRVIKEKARPLLAEQVVALLPPKPVEAGPVSDPPGLSQEAKEILLSALQKARLLDHRFVGTEHLLLAIVDRSPAYPETALLHQAGLTPETTTQEIRAVLEGGPRDTVVSVRLDQATLRTVDAMVRAGAARSRSEAVFLLARKGIEAHGELFVQLQSKLAEIEAIEAEMRQLFGAAATAPESGQSPPTPGGSEPPKPSGA